MLNIANTTVPQVLPVPRAETVLLPPAQSVLKLESTMTHARHSVRVTDMQVSELYYRIAVSLPEGIDPGEYDYRLECGMEVLSTGLAIVGEYGRAVVEYVKPIQYEQYEN